MRLLVKRGDGLPCDGPTARPPDGRAAFGKTAKPLSDLPIASEVFFLDAG